MKAPRSNAPLVIGLVNNMPDAALAATERQFDDLLQAAAGETRVELRLFSLADIERSEVTRAQMRGRYADIDLLPAAGLDGLIVTGCEPKTADLTQEAFWPSLTRVIDWSETSATPTLWSCLAAHAAVLHRDGVRRAPLMEKCSGVFACRVTDDHALAADLPRAILTPHSRQNGLSAAELNAHGYRVLTASDAAGVDMFVKNGRPSSLFFQGHPEYDACSLPREYVRDAGRFLRGERPYHPALPQGCFDAAAEQAFEALAARARRVRKPALIAEYGKVLAKAALTQTWRPFAVGVARNWLNSAAEGKTGRSAAGEVGAGRR